MGNHLKTQSIKYRTTWDDDQQMRFGRDFDDKSTANDLGSSFYSFSLISGFEKEAYRLMTTKYFIFSEKPFREIKVPEPLVKYVVSEV